MTIQAITHVPVIVRDQDEALAWYRDKLGFQVREDNADLVPDYRWLTIVPGGGRLPCLILMLPQKEGDEERIGNNAMCVLASDDVSGDCERLRAAGVTVVDGPSQQAWGTAAIIADLYGNPYYLVQSQAGS